MVKIKSAKLTRGDIIGARDQNDNTVRAVVRSVSISGQEVEVSAYNLDTGIPIGIACRADEYIQIL